MAAFQFETQLADLQNKYSQDQATQEYGRFLGQQRFSRGREDTNRDFMRSFPKFTGQWAGRLGSGVKSGVFQQDLGDYVGDFNRSQGRMDQDQAASEGQFVTNQAIQSSSYQRALLALQEQLAAQRASQNPFQGYQGVY